MFRRLFNVGSALSLLLCLATVVLWVASWIDGLTVASGQILVFHTYDPAGNFVLVERDWQHRSTAGTWRMLSRSNNRFHERFGFAWGSGKFNDTRFVPGYRSPGMPVMTGSIQYISIQYDLIGIPLWAAFVLLAFLPALWVYRQSRNRRRGSAGCCQSCGYDLRASTDRCPECGTPIPSKLPATAMPANDPSCE